MILLVVKFLFLRNVFLSKICKIQDLYNFKLQNQKETPKNAIILSNIKFEYKSLKFLVYLDHSYILEKKRQKDGKHYGLILLK